MMCYLASVASMSPSLNFARSFMSASLCDIFLKHISKYKVWHEWSILVFLNLKETFIWKIVLTYRIYSMSAQGTHLILGSQRGGRRLFEGGAH